MQDLIGKCIELCPDKKKRQTSVDPKAVPPTPSCSTNTSICSASTSAESVSILNDSAIIGADISKDTPSRVEVTKTGKKTRKRKATFEVAETDESDAKKTKSDTDFFSPTSFNGLVFQLKATPEFYQEGLIKHQLIVNSRKPGSMTKVPPHNLF